MKKKITALMLIVLVVSFTYAQIPTDGLGNITETLGGFDLGESAFAAFGELIGDINASLPDATIAGVTWSDAYIGQLLAIPPHLGVGVSISAANLNLGGVSKLLKLFGMDEPLPVPTLAFPSVALEGRVGGIILPFDVGVRFVSVPAMDVAGFIVDYTNYGVDFRYAIIKQNIILPNISAALGFYGTKGLLGTGFNPAELAGVDHLVQTNDEEIKLGFSTNVIDARLQLSKTILIITPFVGAGISYHTTETTYSLLGKNENVKTNGVMLRAYGGISLNVFILKINLAGMWNFVSQNWGANVGIRLQL